MFKIVDPFAVIHLSIRPLQISFAILLIVIPLACIKSLICPDIFSIALLFLVFIIAFEFASIFPCFNSLSMHLVILPISTITHSFIAQILSMTILLIIKPMTIINASINIVKFAFSISVAIPPLARVNGSIFPSHCPLPVSEAASHLSFIYCSALICMFHILDLLIGFKLAPLSNCFQKFFSFKIWSFIISFLYHFTKILLLLLLGYKFGECLQCFRILLPFPRTISTVKWYATLITHFIYYKIIINNKL